MAQHDNNQYIPPHARDPRTPDKSITSTSPDSIFEPRIFVDTQNVTVRKSSIFSNSDIKEISEPAVETRVGIPDDLTNDPTPINPKLMAMLKSIDDKLTDQGGTLNKLVVSQNMMQKSIDFAHANSSDLKGRIVVIEKENLKLTVQNEQLNSQARDMARRLDNIEQQLAQSDHNNRRRNIVIDGVGESEGENTRDIAVDILSSLDKSLTKGDIDFTQRVYRPGGKSKPILVVLKSTSQRDMIMNKKKSLKGLPNMANIWLNEDANPKIRKQKLESRSVVKHALNKGYDAKQKGLGVVVNGRYYNRANMNQLPEDIKLGTTKMREDANTVGFQGKLAPLSNMYPCSITVDGKDHKSAEHFIQYTKVMLANLEDLAQQIKDTVCPYTAKNIGGSVQIPMWNNLDEQVVKLAIKRKYEQNPHLRKMLLDTGSKTILECTPDLKWGAGISLDSKLFGTGRHRGGNLTGCFLQEERVEIRDKIAQLGVPPHPQSPGITDRGTGHSVGQAQSTAANTDGAGADRPEPEAVQTPPKDPLPQREQQTA